MFGFSVGKLKELPKQAATAISTKACETKQAVSAISIKASEKVVFLSKSAVVERVLGTENEKLVNAALLGIDFKFKSTNEIVVSKIENGSPGAYSSGLAVGDHIVSIDGVALNDADMKMGDKRNWIISLVSGELGCPVWLEIAPCNKIRGNSAEQTFSICLVRCEQFQVVALETDEVDCGIEIEQSESSPDICRVAAIIPGGSAWLATQSCSDTTLPIARGDVIMRVGMDRPTNRHECMQLLNTPKNPPAPFDRVELEILRGEETLNVSLVRSPRLSDDAMSRALIYKAEVARWPALPPALRSTWRRRRFLDNLIAQAPPVSDLISGASSDPVMLEVVAAHAAMLDGLFVLPPERAAGTGGWTDEQQWAAAALCCSLLAQQHAMTAAAWRDDGGGSESGNEALGRSEDSGSDAVRGTDFDVSDPASAAVEKSGAESLHEGFQSGCQRAAGAREGDEMSEEAGWAAQFGRRLEETVGVPPARRAALRHLVAHPDVPPAFYAHLLLTSATNGLAGEEAAIVEKAKDGRAGGRAWSLCLAVLAAAMARGGNGNKFSCGGRHYDARARAMLRRLAGELGVPWRWMVAGETALARQFCLLQDPPPPNAGTGGEGGVGAGRIRRYAAIGTAALAGGAVIGATGGLATPAVVAGLGMAGSALGLGSSLAAGAAGFTGLGVVVGVAFGAAGGGLVGYKVARRTGDLEEFAFDLVDQGGGAAVLVGVGGWLGPGSDAAWKAWEPAMAAPDAADGAECLVLRWESDALRRLGSALSSFVKGQMQSQLVDVAGTLALGAAYASLAWPMALIQAADVLDGPWAVAQQRADSAGARLAEALLARAHGHRPVTLVGFGMGARVVLHCLRRLRRRGKAGQGIVETAVCLGTPAPADSRAWVQASQVCAHKLVNAYSCSDWVLALAYRSSSLTRAVAGLQAIPNIDGEGALVNLDVSHLVKTHWEYRDRLPELLRLTGVSPAEGDCFVPNESLPA